MSSVGQVKSLISNRLPKNETVIRITDHRVVVASIHIPFDEHEHLFKRDSLEYLDTDLSLLQDNWFSQVDCNKCHR